MRYYIWVDQAGHPLTPALPYEDETERLVEETRPPRPEAMLHTGTKEELKAALDLREQDFME